METAKARTTQGSACAMDAPAFAPERDLSSADGGLPRGGGGGWKDAQETRSPGRLAERSPGAVGSPGREVITTRFL